MGVHFEQGGWHAIQILPMRVFGGVQLSQVVAVPEQVAQGAVQGLQLSDPSINKPFSHLEQAPALHYKQWGWHLSHGIGDEAFVLFWNPGEQCPQRVAPATAWNIKPLKAYWVQFLLKTVFIRLKRASWAAWPVKFKSVLFTNVTWAGIKLISLA